MASEAGSGPSPVARLAAALSAAGAAPTPREIAELLWLASQLEEPAEEPLDAELSAGQPGTGRPVAPGTPATAEDPPGPAEQPPAAPAPAQPTEPPVRAAHDRVPLRLPAPRSPDGPRHHPGT
ncbi:serine/threonine protein kinase, partial [Streptomyces massasporeus]